LLLFSFGNSLILPFLTAPGEPKLPACCRRDGSHHCAKKPSAKESSESSLALSRSSAKCPFYPLGKAIPAAEKSVVLKPRFVLQATIISRPAALEQTEALFHMSFSRALQQRGPPSL